MSLDLGPGSDAAGSLPVMGQLPVPVAVAAPQESGPPSRRLPLFLLHASLLI